MSKRNASAKPTVDPALLAACQTIFARFDPKQSGLVASRHAVWMVRLTGRTPSNKEVDDIVAELTAPTRATGITFEQFLEVLARPPLYEFSEKDIRDAFRTFDVADRGFVKTAELGSHLESLAEMLDVDEAKEFLRLADFEGTGRIDYERFLTRSFTTKPVGQAKEKKRPRKEAKQVVEASVAEAPMPEVSVAPAEITEEVLQMQTATPAPEL